MEEYLKVLLEQIRCQKAKPAIEKEMRSHIEDEAAALTAEGMEKTQALEAAIKEMGSPVEAGIALDAIHRPKPAWKLILLLAFLSVASFLLQCVIGLNHGELGAHHIFTSAAEQLFGFSIMLFVYHLDYSILAKTAKTAALIFIGGACLFFLFGNTVNGSVIFLSINGVSFSMSFYMMLTFAVWKNWFHVNRRAFTAAFWGVIVVLPVIAAAMALHFHWLAGYHETRLLSFLPGIRIIF